MEDTTGGGYESEVVPLPSLQKVMQYDQQTRWIDEALSLVRKGKRVNIEEINEKIINRLQDGRGQAADVNGCCQYKDPNGVPCAVGCLLEEHYTPDMENSSMHHVNIFEGRWVCDVTSRDTDLEKSAQALADTLNKAGVPATMEVYNLLYNWQGRHDSEENWDGNKYIGHIPLVSGGRNG